MSQLDSANLDDFVGKQVCVVCRRGNDSRNAVRALLLKADAQSAKMVVKNVEGGLAAWQKQVDPDLPLF